MKTMLIALACLVAGSGAAAAQGWIEPVPGAPHVVKLRTSVRVAVTGRTARVTIEEWFQNRGRGLAEGVYHYPFGRHAVFHDFSLWQGDHELKGETLDAERARAIYEAIVRRKKDPALIELVGERLVRARVFPIGPGETRRIALRFTQHLPREGDAVRFRWLAGVGSGAVPTSFELRADSAGRFGAPYSPTHAVRTRRDAGDLVVSLRDSTPSGTVDLVLPLSRPVTGVTLLTHRPAGEDGYFLLLLAPGRAEGRGAARDLTVVLDVSGSMAGEKLEQAKRALVHLLATLTPDDRFRLAAFSGSVRQYRTGWTRATREERETAGEWIRALEARGGTNIRGALAAAFEERDSGERLPLVVFLTDGRPTVDETDPERLASAAEEGRGRARVFALGIGDDVNTYLLERIGESGRGAAGFLPPGADIEEEVGALAAKIAHPVLTDLAVGERRVELYDVTPDPLPDLFAGEELVVLGRYRNGNDEWGVTVRGRRAGRELTFTADGADGAGDDDGSPFIPRLWAARRVAYLTRQVRLHGPSDELVREIRDLGLRFGILTEYTSYLVEEPEMVADAPAPMPRPMAADEQVGRVARERAARSQGYAAAKTAGELEEVLVTAAAPARPTRHVGGRVFVLRGDVWHDIGVRQAERVVAVRPYSEAYFALARALPEVRPYLSLGERVRIAGRAVTVEIDEAGVATLSETDVRRLVRDFRP